MRSRVRDLIKSVASGVLATAMVVTGVFGALLAGAGSASAAPSDALAQPQTGVAPFGLLGPVGLGAVVLGVLGMAAGLARRRREVAARAAAARRAAARARAAQYAHPEDYGYPVPRPSAPPIVEQPTQRLEPVERTRAA